MAQPIQSHSYSLGRKPENYLASLYLASSIIAFNFFDR
ncbi:hypothetical protein LEP1GSC056_1759 [Leptospira borgpetersenii str. Brem 328]|uniref:Uncharacterized protein n=1 Tax=Leptospira borgpetersenii str. Brem 328 TaxID=1049780 RepID=A0ABC9SLM2_LEPBO|nr:hypothetical protein LEP1GSC056_1759 [Leptospira borgpetersenii str. Brem 328]